ncbi:hypothetical protein GCWU000325_00523 [Alloprevotella tannerae ATCC 51259]|uniref:Uncharacterized protein n=1 Tax=Alloprevotella tannerae ATCC 51259 TaxID=626522 RepID=C9LE97_9BACT|nr:hypothetical protein GCWU000325_00523 [Alloprevotella tannerae ATCC 51259]
MPSLIRKANIWSIFYIPKTLCGKVAIEHLDISICDVLVIKISSYRDD